MHRYFAFISGPSGRSSLHKEMIGLVLWILKYMHRYMKVYGYVYIYIYIHIHIHIYIHIHTHTYIHTHIYIYIYIYTHKHTHGVRQHAGVMENLFYHLTTCAPAVIALPSMKAKCHSYSDLLQSSPFHHVNIRTWHNMDSNEPAIHKW